MSKCAAISPAERLLFFKRFSMVLRVGSPMARSVFCSPVISPPIHRNRITFNYLVNYTMPAQFCQQGTEALFILDNLLEKYSIYDKILFESEVL